MKNYPELVDKFSIELFRFDHEPLGQLNSVTNWNKLAKKEQDRYKIQAQYFIELVRSYYRRKPK